MAHLPGFANLAGFVAGFLIKASNFITRNDPQISSEQQENRPCPSLVGVPFHFIVESIKEQLRVVKYVDVIMSEWSDHKEYCVVCLSIMEGDDEVRQVGNCKHVFHKDCIDAWIDKCKTTCPVCRSDLVPVQREKDSWRKERMMYLFGHDSFF